MTQKKFLVFVVEDDRHLQKMIVDYLTEHFPDIEINLYKTGEDALIDLKIGPDLIILDYFLSLYDKDAMDGLTVLSHIRQANKTVRVVMFTGQEDPDVAASAIKMGAFDYIVKSPESFNKLSDIITQLKKQIVNETPPFDKRLLIVLLIGIIMPSALFIFRH